jgi:hypothetical protein
MLAHRVIGPIGGGRSTQEVDDVAEARSVHRLIRPMSGLWGDAVVAKQLPTRRVYHGREVRKWDKATIQAKTSVTEFNDSEMPVSLIAACRRFRLLLNE